MGARRRVRTTPSAALALASLLSWSAPGGSAPGRGASRCARSRSPDRWDRRGLGVALGQVIRLMISPCDRREEDEQVAFLGTRLLGIFLGRAGPGERAGSSPGRLPLSAQRVVDGRRWTRLPLPPALMFRIGPALSTWSSDHAASAQAGAKPDIHKPFDWRQGAIATPQPDAAVVLLNPARPPARPARSAPASPACPDGGRHASPARREPHS